VHGTAGSVNAAIHLHRKQDVGANLHVRNEATGGEHHVGRLGAYFLAAKSPSMVDYAAEKKAMRTIKMDLSIKDAGFRVLKLLSTFQDKLEAQDIESMLADEPKMYIGCW
jgi:hypothetical protein